MSPQTKLTIEQVQNGFILRDAEHKLSPLVFTDPHALLSSIIQIFGIRGVELHDVVEDGSDERIAKVFGLEDVPPVDNRSEPHSSE